MPDGVVAAGDRRLRWSVQVGEAGVWDALHPVNQHGGGKDLAAPEDTPQAGEIVVGDGVEPGQVAHGRWDREPLGQL